MPRSGVLALLAAGALVVGGAALADASFSDPPGDHNDAPDITAVDVSETPDGLLAVRVTVANFQVLPPDAWINLWFDLDNNPRTGEDGDEANVVYEANGVLDFVRWNGSEMIRTPTTGMTGSYAAGTFTFSAPKSAFGNTAGFGLLVVTARQDSHAEQLDEDVIAADFASERGRLAYVSPGPAAFTDLAGDEDAAPDVTAVDVTDSDDGWIAFRLTTPNLRTLPADRAVVIGIDRDRKASTGEAGADVSVGWQGGAARPVLQRWDPVDEEWVDDRAPTRVRAHSADGTVVVEIHRSELDDVGRFGFATISVDFTGPNESVFETEDELEALDYAPEQGFWQYTLANKPPLHLVAGVVSARPGQPVHGRRFTIRAPVRRSDTLEPIGAGSVHCAVRTGLAARARWVRASGRFRAGAAECTLVVPVGASGNVLSGQMTIRALGANGIAKFTFEVR